MGVAMMSGSSANLRRAETAKRADTIGAVRYRIELDVTGSVDPAIAEFPVVATISFDVAARPAEVVWLDFLGAGIDAVHIDGAPQAVRYDGARLLLPGLTPGARNEVVVHARGRYSRSGEGLHRMVDPADDETYLYTQFEPADARRLYPCFEQPDIKGTFEFVVRAPSDWVVLSNGALERIDQDATATSSYFAATKPMSTYITAVVAGPYYRVEEGYRRGDLSIPLGVYCRASLAKYLDADEIFTVTRAGLDFFHDLFDYEYPFGKYDQVFVPEYNLGAMENPGCVTFTESYIYRGRASRAQRERRATTILHEMAHMWFGDLVTMRWWNELWLKESFADYMGTLACAEVTEFTEAWVSFAIRRKAWAYQQDKLPTTHPISADVEDIEAAKLNFDGITYAKGASVLKQLVEYAGRDSFIAGCREYFVKHAYGNTTLDDLLHEVSRMSWRPLGEWANAWLRTTGVTVLAARPSGTSAIVVTQDPVRPQRMTIARLCPDVDGTFRTNWRTETRLTKAKTKFELPTLPTRTPAIVLPNDTDHTYAVADLDERSLETVRTSLDRVEDPLARAVIWSSLWEMTREATLPARDYADMAMRFGPKESHSGLLSAIVDNTAYAIERFASDADRDTLRSSWLAATFAAATDLDEGSDEQLIWFRGYAAAAARDAGDVERVAALLAGDVEVPGVPLDPPLRWTLWLALAAHDRADMTDLERELAADGTSAGRIGFLSATSAFPDPEVVARAWRSLTESDDPTNDEVDATIRGLRAGPSAELLEPYRASYFELLERFWFERSIEIAQRLVIGLYPRTGSTDDVDAWLAAHPQAPRALLRLVIEQRDHHRRSIAARTAG